MSREDRKGFIGSADAYTIWKGHPYALLQLWEEKVGLKERNQFLTPAMEHGIKTEEKAREFFSKIMGEVYWPQRLYHSQYPWLRASLDGLSFSGTRAVEIKCPSNIALLESAKNKIFDETHEIQIQHQMMVSGLDMIYYFIYVSDHINGMFPIMRNEDIIDDLFVKERKFWDCVEKKVPPATEIQDPIWEDLEAKYVLICEQEKQIKKSKDQIFEKLKEIAKGNSIIGKKILLTRYFRKGSIKYSDIPELKNINLDMYRGEDIEIFSATLRKSG